MAREPFPPLVRRALLWPLGVFGACWVLAMLSKGSNATAGLWLIATAVAGVIELVAIPTAIVLLVRDPARYASAVNIMLVLAAATPIVIVTMIVLLFSGALGTFHI